MIPAIRLLWSCGAAVNTLCDLEVKTCWHRENAARGHSGLTPGGRRTKTHFNLVQEAELPSPTRRSSPAPMGGLQFTLHCARAPRDSAMFAAPPLESGPALHMTSEELKRRIDGAGPLLDCVPPRAPSDWSDEAKGLCRTPTLSVVCSVCTHSFVHALHSDPMTTAWPAEYGSNEQADALHSMMAEMGPAESNEWQEQWVDMLAMGSDAFTRALVQAEHDLEQTSSSAADSESNGARCAPASDAQAPLDSTAFQQWAQRIAHLQILDVDEAITLSDADEPESKTPAADSSIALASSCPLTDLSVDQQLLKLKLLLAQEEARSVHLEDRLSRCLFELDSERKECASLRATNAALTSKNLQQTVSNTAGCAEGCGLVRLEKERLAKQNEVLTMQLQTIEQQTASLIRQVEAQAAASTRASTPVAAAARSSSVSPAATATAAAAAPSLPSPVRLPAFPAATAASTSASAASVPAAAVPSTPASPSSAAAAASGISLLRVRSSLALARSTLRHQGEISHLMRYKIDALSMQMRMDDLEATLDSERELAAIDAAELARTKAALASKTEEEQALQAVVANLAQQLHRFAGSRGMGMSVSMSSPALAARPSNSVNDDPATATEAHANRIHVLPTPTPSPGPAAVAAPFGSPPPSSSSAASATVSASVSASAAATAAAVNAGLMTPPRRMPPLHSPYYPPSAASVAATPAAPSSVSSSLMAASPAQPPLVLTTSTPTHGRSESSASNTSSGAGGGGGVIGWTAGWFGSAKKPTDAASIEQARQMQSPAQQTMQSR